MMVDDQEHLQVSSTEYLAGHEWMPRILALSLVAYDYVIITQFPAPFDAWLAEPTYSLKSLKSIAMYLD